MNIALIPGSKEYLNDRMFDPSDTKINRDNCAEYWHIFQDKVKELGYRLHTFDIYDDSEIINIVLVERVDFNIGVLLKILKKNPRCRVFYFMSEPTIISPINEYRYLKDLPFEKIFTWNDDEIKKSDKMERLNYVNPAINIDNIPNVVFSKKKLIATIAGNKASNFANELYSERLRIAEAFSKKQEGFDLYGRGWKNDERAWVRNVWKGEVKNKQQTLKNYKFTLAFENSFGYEGYITEKIFDAFNAGTVPIYYGAKNIGKFIPKRCFIDYRDFKKLENLYSFISEMNEEEYNQYTDEIKKYLSSENYKPFCSENFSNVVIKEIQKVECSASHSYMKLRFKLMLNLFYKRRIFKYSKRYFFDVLLKF